jgi:hypothetical protein
MALKLIHCDRVAATSASAISPLVRSTSSRQLGGEAIGDDDEICNLCNNPIESEQPKWKRACQHHECGRKMDLASKACQKDAATRAAFATIKILGVRPVEGDRGEREEDQEALEAENARLRALIATKYGTPGYQAEDVRQLLVKAHRKHTTKRIAKMVLMDKKSFMAHMKYVRGWSRKARVSKWHEVERNPGAFRTVTDLRGVVKLWVPSNPEVAVEDEIGVSTLDDDREVSMPVGSVRNFLFGQGGGVLPDSSALQALAGPGINSAEFGFDTTCDNPYLSDGGGSDISGSGSSDGSRHGLRPCPGDVKYARCGPRVQAQWFQHCVPGRPSCPSTMSLRDRPNYASRNAADMDEEEIAPEDSASQVAASRPQQAVPSSSISATRTLLLGGGGSGNGAGSRCSRTSHSPSTSLHEEGRPTSSVGFLQMPHVAVATQHDGSTTLTPTKRKLGETEPDSASKVSDAGGNVDRGGAEDDRFYVQAPLYPCPNKVDILSMRVDKYESQLLQKPLHLLELQSDFTAYMDVMMGKFGFVRQADTQLIIACCIKLRNNLLFKMKNVFTI